MRIVIVAIAIILAACSTELFQPQAEIPTASYKAVWINASWSGGRTGTPLSQTAESPPQWFGALCRANLLTLENHPDNFVFAKTLTANNTCTIPLWWAGASPRVGIGRASRPAQKTRARH